MHTKGKIGSVRTNHDMHIYNTHKGMHIYKPIARLIITQTSYHYVGMLPIGAYSVAVKKFFLNMYVWISNFLFVK